VKTKLSLPESFFVWVKGFMREVLVADNHGARDFWERALSDEGFQQIEVDKSVLEREWRVRPRLVIEGPVERVPQEKMLAYDVDDVLARYAQLEKSLTREEIEQLVEHDETGMVIACLAEVAEMEVYPYDLMLIGGRVGSVVEVKSDGGEPIWVFRDMLSMMESRVAKFPEDRRSQAVLNAFSEVIVPAMKVMNEGEKLVYFSPPDEDAFIESKYGFMYVLEKRWDEYSGIEELKGHSIKVEWDGATYKDVLRQFGYEVEKGDYETLVSSVMRFVNPEMSTEEVIDLVWKVAGDERRQANVDNGKWLEKQVNLYNQVGKFVERRIEGLAKMIVNGDREATQRLVSQLQLEWLARTRPLEFKEIMEQAERFGYGAVMLACGLMEIWGGTSNSVEMGMMGMLGGADKWEFKIGDCVKCGAKNVDIGPCKLCRECEHKFDMGIFV